MEFVYKLNLPPLTSILKSDTKILESKNRYNFYKSADIIKPEWIHWNDMYFNSASSFYRNLGDGDSSTIHTDQRSLNSLPWGINFIHRGYGTLEYWLPDQIEKFNWAFHRTTSNTDHTVPEMTTTRPPYKTYIQTPGAYLVNAAVPHRAKGWNSRLGVSIRSTECFSMRWEDVVEKFKKYM